MEEPDTIHVRFASPEVRQHWDRLCRELGHDPHALACRLLTNFIKYCEDERPEYLQGVNPT